MSRPREVFENKPTLTVFAGPNGSGKTTLVEAFSREADLGIVVNADAIGARLAQQTGQLQANPEQQLQAAIEAEAYRYQLIEHRQSFVIETVMSDQVRWRRFFHAAIEPGFVIHLVFVSTSDPEINVKRVGQLVLAGGHDVNPSRIRERYAKAHAFLPEVVGLADVVMVLDNSDPANPYRFLLAKSVKDGDMEPMVPLDELPIWATLLMS